MTRSLLRSLSRAPAELVAGRGALRIFLVWLGIVAGAACADSGEASGEPPGDLESTTAELMAADRAFASDSRARGADAWAAIWAERGRLETTSPAAVGPAEVRAAVAASLGAVLPRMGWAPAEAGTWWEDAGWTWGNWWIEPPGGGEPVDTGRYLTGWIREDGRWKVALDVSVPDCHGVPDARQFDFWTGDWQVAQRIRAGADWEEYPARSDVEPVADGCLLIERWSGTVRFPWEGMEEPSALRGGSIRYLDLESGTWRIQWIDDRANGFGPPSVGGFEGTRGVFMGTGARPARIVFDQGSGGAVEWRLETPVGDDWLPIWTMTFTR